MANNRTRIVGRGLQVIPANSAKLFDAIDRTQDRKSLVVSNLATVADGYKVYVAGSDNEPAFAIFPFDRQVFDSSDAFAVINPNGVAVTVIVGEVFLPTGGAALTLGPGASGGSGGGGGEGGGAYAGGQRRQYLP